MSFQSSYILNKDITSKLSGVSDEVVLATDLSVAAGATVNIVSSLIIKDAVSFVIGVSSDAGSPNISIDYIPIVNGLVSSGLGGQKLINNKPLNNNRGLSNKCELLTNTMRLTITNYSSNTRLFTIHLYKIYNANYVEKMEYYGATVSDRPLASNVPVGAVFMSLDTQQVFQSNGTVWGEL